MFRYYPCHSLASKCQCQNQMCLFILENALSWRGSVVTFLFYLIELMYHNITWSDFAKTKVTLINNYVFVVILKVVMTVYTFKKKILITSFLFLKVR